MKKISILTLALSVFCTLAFAQEKSIEKSYDGIKTIDLSTASGDVYIKKGNSDKVEVEVKYTYDDDEVEFIFEQSGSKLKIKEEWEGRNHSGYNKWYLTLPDGLELNTNSGSGDVEIEGLDIEFKLNCGSGDLAAADISGETSVNIGSGDVSISESESEVKLNTGSGDVSLSEHNGDVSVNVGSGDIQLSESKGAFKINAGSGDIEVNEVEIAGKSGFNAGSGDVSVVLGKELNYDISVNSGSGDAVLDFDGTPIEGEVIMKASKRNGEIIAPFDFDSIEEIKNGKDVTVKKMVKMGNKDISINISTGSGKAVIKE